ncbi:MAG: PP2C family protein-serine/threonine phosphatase, partial [Fibrobacterota bacterium]
AALFLEEKENPHPWELVYETRFREPDWKQRWFFDRNIQVRTTNEGLTASAEVECPFMTYREPFALQEWDLCWEAELSSFGVSFFFNGSGLLRDSRIVTPDFTGYTLGMLFSKFSGLCDPTLKRNCMNVVWAKPMAPPKSHYRMRAEKSGGITRFFLNGRRIFEYADPHFVRYSRGAHTGLLLAGQPSVLHSLRLFRRPAHGDRAGSHQTCDLRFIGQPDEIFEAEFFPRRNIRSDVTDISLRRVTELRKAQSAVNALLAEKEENLRRIHKELELAGSVVERLVPRQMPVLPGVTFEAHFKPSESVGGDLFDLIQLDDNRAVILMYDVSGHGVSAALISVMTRTLFQKAFDPDAPILPQLQAINAELCRIISSTHFVAYFCGILDAAGRSLRYVGGGLPYPAVVGKGQLVLLQSQGSPMGIHETLKAQEKTLLLKSGDKLLLFTDGLYEIFDGNNEMYGRQRLMDFSSAHASLPVHELVQALLVEHRRYLNGAPASDDVTLLGVQIS